MKPRVAELEPPPFSCWLMMPLVTSCANACCGNKRLYQPSICVSSEFSKSHLLILVLSVNGSHLDFSHFGLFIYAFSLAAMLSIIMATAQC